MITKLAGLFFGLLFGFILAWARVHDPETIHAMLRLVDPYLYLMMGSAIATAAIGVRVLRAVGARALLTGERIRWSAARPDRDTVVGSVLFGLGWAIAGTCPAPVAVQLGSGQLMALSTAVGLFAGVALRGALVARAQPAAIPEQHSVAGL